MSVLGNFEIADGILRLFELDKMCSVSQWLHWDSVFKLLWPFALAIAHEL